jgi:hypothetical protein
MYNGVIALILGEAWLFRSIGLAEYALLGKLCVTGHEASHASERCT